jgi:hypothetical protein
MAARDDYTETHETAAFQPEMRSKDAGTTGMR